MTPVHPTLSMRRLTKIMTVAEIARRVGTHHTTLLRIAKGQRHSDVPVDLAERLQQLLAETTRVCGNS
jgi:transcriptional regulator with XRE-family HTH domain